MSEAFSCVPLYPISAAVIGAVESAARTSPNPGADSGTNDLGLAHWKHKDLKIKFVAYSPGSLIMCKI